MLVSDLGRVEEAEYAVVQVEVVGSVIQAAMLVKDFGRVAAALYVPVQAVAVGSVIQPLIGVRSVESPVTIPGMVPVL